MCDGSTQDSCSSSTNSPLSWGQTFHLNISLHVVASSNSTSDDLGLKSSHKWPICPLWKYHKYHNTSCICGSGIDNVVYCKDNQSTISIVSCYCMSYSDNGDGVVVGACPFLCRNYFYMDIYSDNNLSTLCDRDIRQNRQGQMCRQCKDNHSHSLYSKMCSLLTLQVQLA